jgi:hypothetical protein
VDKSSLDAVFWQNDSIYKEAIFQDAEEVLNKLSQDKNLGIFSQGNPELQTRKLEAGGIEKFFNKELIFIRERKLSEEATALLNSEATVIDNKHDVVATLSKFVNVIWLNRKTEDNDPQIKTIHTLKELI